MYGRQKKTPATPDRATTSTTDGTPQSFLRDRRLSSPNMVFRLEEKNKLANLNDRLAEYIDRVLHLEEENGRLRSIVETHKTKLTLKGTGISELYEGELNSARKLLDDVTNEKAKLQFENGKMKTDLEDLRAKLHTKEVDLTATQKKLTSAEFQVNNLQARLSDAVKQRHHWEDEYNKLKKDYDALAKRQASDKKQLEEETVMRVSLENRIQSLKEELDFKSEVYKQLQEELKELQKALEESQREVVEVDGRLHEEYRNKLCEALKKKREEIDEQLRQNNEETEAFYETKLQEMRELLSGKDDDSVKAQAELKIARKRIYELTTQKQNNESRIRELEDQLERHELSHVERATLTNEIERLKMAIDDQLKAYHELMDIKIQLDAELEVYRKLLDAEERRLDSSMADTSSVVEVARKRKRVELDVPDTAERRGFVHDARSSVDFSVSTFSKDVLKISEANPEAKFIKIFNTSADKEVQMGNWQLKHVAGDEESTYKFHRTLRIAPQQTITIWSSDAEQTHTPPSNLVMKEQTWHLADEMKTTLLNAKGNEMASRTMKRVVQHTTPSFVPSVESPARAQTNSARKNWAYRLLFSLMK